jgi:hypothetical protein
MKLFCAAADATRTEAAVRRNDPDSRVNAAAPVVRTPTIRAAMATAHRPFYLDLSFIWSMCDRSAFQSR